MATESKNASAAAVVLPLALGQFIASYAATNMNVAISTIAEDIGTTVTGIQTAITLFTLTMAALMIPGSKLTDYLGRKVCFIAGLIVYGAGALLSAFAQGIGLLVVGYSLLEGIGSALLIPPIYILVTVVFEDVNARARNFGIVSGAAGLGAAAGPLLGGLITSYLGWRASFYFQVAVIVLIIVLALRITDPPLARRPAGFDVWGAVLSAAGLFFVVFGVLQTSTYGWIKAREDFTIGGTVVIPQGGVSPVWIYVAIGAVLLTIFFFHLRRVENHHRAPLFSLRIFRSRASNLGLVTQVLQWLVMQGAFFVTSVFLQQIRGYNAIETGLVLVPATIGVLASSALAGRMTRRHSLRRLIRFGFSCTTLGLLLMLLLVREDSSIWTFVPGLLLMGIGIGVMLTASVNLVQSSSPDEAQGDISGVSRSVSNLGSSLGTALVGSVLAGAAVPGNGPFGIAFILLVCLGLVGVVTALFIPRPVKR
ncbi:MFS transporter [Amycolatopsis rhabdoformis]|uniref:MFS transporter n=1 Tax=Amycolatopsis rhabdoformis TaxID=1448059 RepID=A0ABZ1IBG8_9PSEU|nr:MFS transporter [Amycolatopsis rhabdoformis]WSE31816.1 MFS transporter [Amycolatopsis rhabdoformis]